MIYKCLCMYAGVCRRQGADCQTPQDLAIQKVLMEHVHKSFVSTDRVKEMRYKLMDAVVEADWMA